MSHLINKLFLQDETLARQFKKMRLYENPDSEVPSMLGQSLKMAKEADHFFTDIKKLASFTDKNH